MVRRRRRKKRYMKYPKNSVGHAWGYWGADFKLNKAIRKKPRNPTEYF